MKKFILITIIFMIPTELFASKFDEGMSDGVMYSDMSHSYGCTNENNVVYIWNANGQFTDAGDDCTSPYTKQQNYMSAYNCEKYGDSYGLCYGETYNLLELPSFDCGTIYEDCLKEAVSVHTFTYYNEKTQC